MSGRFFSPALLRASVWFLGLILVHVVLQFLWRNAQPSCYSAAVSRLLITLLFTERGFLELYAHLYVADTDPETKRSGPVSLFSGRSALWVRLVLSFALLVTAFLAVVEGAAAVFEYETTPSTKQRHFTAHATSDTAEQEETDGGTAGGRESSSLQSSSSKRRNTILSPAAAATPNRMNHAMFQRGKSPMESSSTDHILHNQAAADNKDNNNNDAYDVLVGNKRKAPTGLYKDLKSRRQDSNEFRPGAGDPYSLLLPTQPLCELSTALVSSLAVWLIHVLVASLAQAVTARTYYSPMRRARREMEQHQQQQQRHDQRSEKNDEEENGDYDVVVVGTDHRHSRNSRLLIASIEASAPVWALQVDLLTELKLSSAIAMLSFILHGASQLWKLDPGSEVESYVSLFAGGCILYIEGGAIMSVAKALTLALSPSEQFLVEQVELGMAQSMTSASVSSLRAFKTESGRLGLVVECTAMVAASGAAAVAEQGEARRDATSAFSCEKAVEKEIISLIKTNTTWDRLIDQQLILLNFSRD